MFCLLRQWQWQMISFVASLSIGLLCAHLGFGVVDRVVAQVAEVAKYEVQRLETNIILSRFLADTVLCEFCHSATLDFDDKE